MTDIYNIMFFSSFFVVGINFATLHFLDLPIFSKLINVVLWVENFTIKFPPKGDYPKLTTQGKQLFSAHFHSNLARK